MNRKLMTTLVAAILWSGVAPVGAQPLPQPVSSQPASPEAMLIAQGADARTLYDQALQSYNSRQFEAAVRLLDQAINLNPQFAEAYVLRGLAREKTGWQEGAIADYDLAIQLLPNGESKATTYYNRGLAYSNLKQVQAAIDDFTAAIQLKPTYPDAYYQRGVIRSENNDAQAGLDDFNKAIQQNSNFLRAYAQRGLTLGGYLGDIQAATRDLLAASRLDPQNNAEAFWNRGAARLELGDLRGAESDFSQAIQRNSSYLRPYYSRARVRYLQGNLEGSKTDLQTAIELDAKQGSTDLFLGTILAELAFSEGQAENNSDLAQQALQVLNVTIDQHPDKALAYASRGNIYALSDPQRAVADFDRAIELEPNFAAAYFARSKTYVDQQNVQGAIADLDQAIQLSPNYADAYLNRGILRLQSGDRQGQADLEKAGQIFDEVAALNPNSAAYAYSRIGAVWQYLGNSQESIRWFQQAVTLYQAQGNTVQLAAAQQAIAMVQQGGGNTQQGGGNGQANRNTQQVNRTTQSPAETGRRSNSSQNTIQRREQADNQVATGDFILQEQGVLQPGGSVLSSDNSLYQTYTFQGRRGQSVTITLNSNDFDTYLILLDSDDQKIAESDDISSSNTNSEIRMTLPANGTYSVVVNTYDASGQGRYQLTVR
jgi:tetratricopeptide (TPR) repeat protein